MGGTGPVILILGPSTYGDFFQMYYFKKNIGDYAKKTGRLSMLQHGAYTLLIDACYDRERFPTMDEAIEWTWASTTEEIEAVQFVLRKFFCVEDGVFVQKRIQEEIAEYHGKAETNKRIALAREAKRKGLVTERAQTVNEAPPNQEPRTINQEPQEKKKRSASAAPVVCPSDVDEKVWADFLAIRKAKRAPLTDTALDGINREAVKAGLSLADTLALCCTRGWQSFKAEWVASSRTATPQVGKPRTTESFYERDQRLKAEQVAQFAPGIAAKPPVSFDFIEGGVSDVTAIESN